MKIHLPEDYKPSEDEEYMSSLQLEYFRLKLTSMQTMLSEKAQEKTSMVLQTREDKDIVDMASWEYAASIELKTSDRCRKLIQEIDKALIRMESGEYGYCEETGEEIGIARLEANPLTVYCIEEQERRERLQNVYNIADD